MTCPGSRAHTRASSVTAALVKPTHAPQTIHSISGWARPLILSLSRQLHPWHVETTVVEGIRRGGWTDSRKYALQIYAQLLAKCRSELNLGSGHDLPVVNRHERFDGYRESIWEPTIEHARSLSRHLQPKDYLPIVYDARIICDKRICDEHGIDLVIQAVKGVIVGEQFEKHIDNAFAALDENAEAEEVQSVARQLRLKLVPIRGDGRPDPFYLYLFEDAIGRSLQTAKAKHKKSAQQANVDSGMGRSMGGGRPSKLPSIASRRHATNRSQISSSSHSMASAPSQLQMSSEKLRDWVFGEIRNQQVEAWRLRDLRFREAVRTTLVTQCPNLRESVDKALPTLFKAYEDERVRERERFFKDRSLLDWIDQQLQAGFKAPAVVDTLLNDGIRMMDRDTAEHLVGARMPEHRQSRHKPRSTHNARSSLDKRGSRRLAPNSHRQKQETVLWTPDAIFDGRKPQRTRHRRGRPHRRLRLGEVLKSLQSLFL